MIKSWLVNCKVNMGMSPNVKMVVKKPTQKEAKSYAINSLFKDGYIHVEILSCEEIK